MATDSHPRMITLNVFGYFTAVLIVNNLVQLTHVGKPLNRYPK